MFQDSAVTRSRFGLGFLTSSVWDVPHEKYGALTYIYGTLVSSAVALAIAVPLSVGAAIFLTELAPKWLSTTLGFAIELLAATPSIVYGLWGFLVLCPFLQAHVNPWLADRLGNNPLFGGPPVLTNMLAAGCVLAIMVMPFVTSVSREVIKAVPSGQRDASIALGATRWETIKRVVLSEAKPGIAGAVILGLGRALGETMAVVMVIGNTPQIKASLLQPGYTMPSLLANEFNEAYNDKLQRSALLEIALILFCITLVVNAIARLQIMLTEQKLATSKRDPSRPSAMEILSVVVDFAGRYLIFFVLGSFLALQAYGDIRSKGIAGLLGPIELLAVAAIVVPLLARRVAAASIASRRLANRAMTGVLSLAALIATAMLGALLLYVATQGVHGLSLQLFTELPRPPGVAGGGLKSSIFGTLELVLIASCAGIPIGLMGGIYIAEFGNRKLANAIRFSADVLNGIPSVVIGLFAYAAFVLPVGHFSAWAGGGALAIMMVPTIVRTTEQMLKLVPHTYREGALALGVSRVQTLRTVILPAARSGVLTGVMLAIARIAGETAPLLFTAFGNDQFSANPSQPVSSLTMKIYQYANSPYNDWIAQAWAGALVLLMIVLALSITARLATRRMAALR